MKELYDKLKPEIKEKLKKIKLLVLDFDGTLTNNKVYVNQEGLESVVADRGDSLGLEYVRKNTNIDVVILSKETNPVTAARAKKLKIPCMYGIDNKINSFYETLNHYEADLDKVCFIGNDLNDIECIIEAGLGVAVGDSYEQVKKVADYITLRNGGDGAVREICEFIMYAKECHPYP